MSSSALYKNQIEELLSCLKKKAPKSCSKPKSKMCSNCLERVSSPRATKFNHFIRVLEELKASNNKLTAEVETELIEFLHAAQ